MLFFNIDIKKMHLKYKLLDNITLAERKKILFFCLLVF